MNGPRDFDATLRSWLQRAAPAEAPDRVLAAALAQVVEEPQRQGWLAGLSRDNRRRVILRGAAVTAVIVLATLAGLRLANIGPEIGGPPSPLPSASSMAEASLPPSGAASVICEAFADGGPMDNMAISKGLPHDSSDLDLLDDSATGLVALTERASGDEREDLLAMATAVGNMTTAYRERTRYSPEEFRDLPQDTQDALQNAAQEAWDAFHDAHPAFYLEYTERCELEQNPPTVDCGGLDQATCDQTVADMIAGYRQAWEDGSYEEGHGPPPGLPVLYVALGGTSNCISHQEIYWPGGGIIADSLCGGGDPLPTPTAIVGSPEVGVPYQVALHDCMVDFPLGDTWWHFENAGPTPGPIIPDTVGTVHGVVTLTSPDTAILRPGDGSELMLLRVEEPIQGSCY